MTTDCCCPPRPDASAERRECPRSGTPGAAVDLLTVKAQLTVQALQNLGGVAYRFCPDPACDVVYFDGSSQVFTVKDVRVPVWQKVPAGDRMVCYCFGENEADMSAAENPSAAVERVRAHIAAGRCACEVRNPKGTCCLGDVIAAARRIEASRL